MRFFLLLAFLGSGSLLAGSFDAYHWKLGYKLGSDQYQATLKIDYEYEVNGAYETALALPRDSNLAVFKLQFIVDGQRVEAVSGNAVTYWSQGRQVPVYLPPPGQKKVSVEALFTIRNLFVIPAAPCVLDAPCKKLEVGFSAIPGFNFGAIFTDQAQKFKPRRIAALEGGPSQVNSFLLTNLKPSTTPSLLFLFPKVFQFSFSNLTNVKNLGGSIDADSRTGSTTDIQGTLKPYSMVFYREQAARDWVYVPTWLQQEEIYLPFGIEPGGPKTRSLFLGANDDRADLLPWRGGDDPAYERLPNDMDSEFDGALRGAEQLRAAFSGMVQVDPSLNALIATTHKGKLSPAAANLHLASQLAKRLKLHAVPAFVTNAKPELMGRIPLGGFSAVITAIKFKEEWYFLDAADASWTLANGFDRLAGLNVLILDGETLRVSTF